MAVTLLLLRPSACRAEPKSSSTGDSSEGRTKTLAGCRHKIRVDAQAQHALPATCATKSTAYHLEARPPPATPRHDLLQRLTIHPLVAMLPN